MAAFSTPTAKLNVISIRLSQVSLDVAMATSGLTGTPTGSLVPAHGIEVCQCPGSYAATSCQDPNIGFWRYFKSEYVSSTILIDLIGLSQPCHCNGRSETCHKETGHCTVINSLQFTSIHFNSLQFIHSKHDYKI